MGVCLECATAGRRRRVEARRTGRGVAGGRQAGTRLATLAAIGRGGGPCPARVGRATFGRSSVGTRTPLPGRRSTACVTWVVTYVLTILGPLPLSSRAFPGERDATATRSSVGVYGGGASGLRLLDLHRACSTGTARRPEIKRPTQVYCSGPCYVIVAVCVGIGRFGWRIGDSGTAAGRVAAYGASCLIVAAGAGRGLARGRGGDWSEGASGGVRATSDPFTVYGLSRGDRLRPEFGSASTGRCGLPWASTNSLSANSPGPPSSTARSSRLPRSRCPPWRRRCSLVTVGLSIAPVDAGRASARLRSLP